MSLMIPIFPINAIANRSSLNHGILKIVGQGSRDLVRERITTPFGGSFKLGDFVEGSFGLVIFVDGDVAFIEPSEIQLGFEFSQSLKKMGITIEDGPFFDLGNSNFPRPVIQKLNGGRACATLALGPQVGFELKIRPGIDGIGDLKGNAVARVENFLKLCAELNTATPSCLSFQTTADIGIDGVLRYDLFGLTDGERRKRFFAENLLKKNWVLNDTDPAISCPTHITVSTDLDQCIATISPGLATATDNCLGVTVSGKRSDGLALTSPYPVGTTTIIWTATDIGDNSVSCQQRVTVRDTQLPKISCPVNKTVMTAKIGDTSAVVDYSMPPATDNCPGVTVSCTPPSGSSFRPGTTEVLCKATDGAGNVSTCSFTVTVFDGDSDKSCGNCFST